MSAEPVVPASSPITVIREAMERVQGQLDRLGEVEMGDDREAALQGQIVGLRFALRALGSED